VKACEGQRQPGSPSLGDKLINRIPFEYEVDFADRRLNDRLDATEMKRVPTGHSAFRGNPRLTFGMRRTECARVHDEKSNPAERRLI
jgi:hypothetical protein